MADDVGRFVLMTDDDLQELLDNRSSDKTKNCIKRAVKLFSEYTIARNSSLADVEQLSIQDLDVYLSRYFAELRETDGSYYKRNTILATRYGLQQHLKNIRGFDIVVDKEFKSFKEMFSAILVNLKAPGKGTVDHKLPLTTDDFKKLYASNILDIDNTNSLQNKVFVDIMVYLCNRGQENLREMKTVDFSIMTDSAGNRYVKMRDFLTKNHRGNSTEEQSQQGRMYEIIGNSKCPVMSFEKYIALLNKECPAFWQKPNPRSKENKTWYFSWPQHLGEQNERSVN